ncbi:MAG: DUF362 domain-containing protein [Candidatus Pacearchaeota archaeon]
MVKGVAVKFSSYVDTIPKVLKLIKLDQEIKKHDRIVIKVNLNQEDSSKGTKIDFLESIIQYCVTNKNPGSEIIIAEGSDGEETMELFDNLGYTKLAEKYGVGLIDLNQSASVEVQNPEFLRFSTIHYPEILLNSFIITATPLANDEELLISASLDTMVGAFPANKYRGFFSKSKNKLENYPIKYQIHDILKCKMPDLALIDASDKGLFIAGKPLDMDKQAAKVMGQDWNRIPHLRLVDESFSPVKKEETVDNLIGKVPENK